jgi:hypothetical protein
MAVGSKPLDHSSRVGPAVDQVTEEDEQHPLGWLSGNFAVDCVEQAIEEIEPTVDVTDDIGAPTAGTSR